MKVPTPHAKPPGPLARRPAALWCGARGLTLAARHSRFGDRQEEPALSAFLLSCVFTPTAVRGPRTASRRTTEAT